MNAALPKRRILLVDDEPKIVDGLQRALRPHRAVWEVATATSGAAALELLEARPFDVVVTDMRMPEMDGASLLAIAKEKYPGTMRVVLSGQTDAAAALRAVPVAHQFLSKPTEPMVLLECLTRMAATKDAIVDASVHAAVGRLDSLPTRPALCRELTELMAREDVSAAAIAALVEKDPAIVLKLLQVVNSAFFGLRRTIGSVNDAVAYLGIDLVKNLCISFSILNALPVRAKRFDAAAFHSHALDVANLARAIGGRGERGDTSFLAGMLHDIGKLAMAFTMPELYDDIARCAAETGRSFEEEESARGTCGHVKVAAYLLDLWGLPYPAVEAIVYQSRIRTDSDVELQCSDAVRIAHRVALSETGTLAADDEERALLARLGILDRLPVGASSQGASP